MPEIAAERERDGHVTAKGNRQREAPPQLNPPPLPHPPPNPPPHAVASDLIQRRERPVCPRRHHWNRLAVYLEWAVEHISRRHSQQVAYLPQASRRDSVRPLLIFLYLLKGNTDRVAQIGLAQTSRDAKMPKVAGDGLVVALRTILPRRLCRRPRLLCNAHCL